MNFRFRTPDESIPQNIKLAGFSRIASKASGNI